MPNQWPCATPLRPPAWCRPTGVLAPAPPLSRRRAAPWQQRRPGHCQRPPRHETPAWRPQGRPRDARPTCRDEARRNRGARGRSLPKARGRPGRPCAPRTGGERGRTRARPPKSQCRRRPRPGPGSGRGGRSGSRARGPGEGATRPQPIQTPRSRGPGSSRPAGQWPPSVHVAGARTQRWPQAANRRPPRQSGKCGRPDPGTAR
mmetsp:Transcript_62615/g.186609  ORF Transcript_62615/g.186609 Transcript_62615/m.186609 type:complete len:204 (-) Transcript_62615:503-1114(-)